MRVENMVLVLVLVGLISGRNWLGSGGVFDGDTGYWMTGGAVDAFVHGKAISGNIPA